MRPVPTAKSRQLTATATRADTRLHMSDLCRLILGALIGLFRSRTALQAEILVLRHQLNVLRRKSPDGFAFGSIDHVVLSSPKIPSGGDSRDGVESAHHSSSMLAFLQLLGAVIASRTRTGIAQTIPVFPENHIRA